MKKTCPACRGNVGVYGIRIDYPTENDLKTMIVISGIKDLEEEADCMALAIFISKRING